MKTNRMMAVMIGALAFVAVGCGSANNENNLFKNAGVTTYQENGDIFVEVKSSINTGNMQLVSIELPVLDRHDPSRRYGKIAVRQSFNGTAELALAINLSDTANLPEFDGRLPNGTAIPVGGLDNVPVVGLPIGGSSAKVYLAYGGGVAMVGVAVPLREFDGLGTDIGNANVFPVYDFGNGVKGIGGIFTGVNPGTSGIALFVDAASALAPKSVESRVMALASTSVAKGTAPQQSKIVFKPTTVSSKKKDKINYELYKMNSKRSRLHVR